MIDHGNPLPRYPESSPEEEVSFQDTQLLSR